ncbi:MAG: hypothetical protein AAF919_15750 [Pseudomonadota bacterium]
MVLRSGDRLRPLGRLSRADDSGVLPRLGRAPSGPLASAINVFAKDLLARTGTEGVSVILRGSLARGARTAADVDLALVTDGAATRPPFDPPDLPLPVEISVVTRETLLARPDGAWPRFALAHCGWTLAGPDLLTDLPPPRLGPVAIAHLRNVRRWWPVAPLDWTAALAERRQICEWLGKRMIRALAEGEMVRRNVYSRDIWPCFRIATLAHPRGRAVLRHIALQAVAPDGRPETLSRMTVAARPLLERAYRVHLGRPLRLPSKRPFP